MNKETLSEEQGTRELVAAAVPTGDVMVKISGKSFRCSCGCNVFRHFEGDPKLYQCNACEVLYRGE